MAHSAEEIRELAAKSMELAGKRKRGSKGPYVCLICKSEKPTKSALLYHICTHTGDRPFKCKDPGCGKEFSRPNRLTEHSRIHTKTTPFHCEYDGCNKKYRIRDSLTLHVKHEHKNIRNHVCIQCTKKFKAKSVLQQHVMQIHTNQRPFACTHDDCYSAFISKAKLNEHMRVHTGEQPFSCTYDGCDQKFSSKGSMKRHMRIHTGERSFHCTHAGCNASFSDSCGLKSHMRIHTGEKPFKCQHCNRAFSQSYALKRHTRVHTGEKPFKCQHCNKAFATSGDLNRHIRQIHDPNRTKPARRQEIRVADYLREQGIPFEWDQRLYICDAKTGRVASTINKDEDGKVYNRPDFQILCYLDRIIIVSCDEHEHNTQSYTWDCEIARMFKVIASLKIGRNGRFDPRPVVWLRFNPNARKVDGKTKRTSMKERYATLLDAIHTAKPGFHYLFYSTTNGRLTHMGAYLRAKLAESPEDENLQGFVRFEKTVQIYSKF